MNQGWKDGSVGKGFLTVKPENLGSIPDPCVKGEPTHMRCPLMPMYTVPHVRCACHTQVHARAHAHTHAHIYNK